MINDIPSNEFHFAGHDTFHLRYTWLPKAADYIKTVKHYVEYGMEEGAYDQVMPNMESEMPQMDPMAGEIGEFPLEKPMMESKDDDIYEF